MKTIELGKIGRFLSGRSRAFEAVEEIQPNPSDNINVNLDGVESMAQSFISELLITFHKHNIDLSTIKFVNYENDHVEKRVKTELDRFHRILIDAS